jgi:hypothetical protein
MAFVENGVSLLGKYDETDTTNKVQINGNTKINGTLNTTGGATIGGNTSITGDVNATGKLAQGTWTRNTVDTYVPIVKNNALEYTKRVMWNSKQSTGYNTEQDRLVTLSALSYWNGAYNTGNVSNLTYAHQGTIQCKATQLYDNSTGTLGTVSLSQTAANFTYLKIYYKKDNVFCSATIYSPNGKKANLAISYVATSTIVQDCCKVVNISGTSITKTSEGFINQAVGGQAGTGASTTNNELYIVRVEGWK